jgi:hypothetical protein
MCEAPAVDNKIFPVNSTERWNFIMASGTFEIRTRPLCAVVGFSTSQAVSVQARP